MFTVRQIEKTWGAQQYDRLLRDLMAARPEGGFQLHLESGRAAAAAAMAVIRLDELSQAQAAICPELIRAILSAQHADGGWGDPAVTALCLRALLCGNGQGVSIERGLLYLATLQKTEGIWPREPLRRMPADALASAFVLFELGDNRAFRATVRFGEAMEWFEKNERSLDAETRRLWDRTKVRCLLPRWSPVAAASGSSNLHAADAA